MTRCIHHLFSLSACSGFLVSGLLGSAFANDLGSLVDEFAGIQQLRLSASVQVEFVAPDAIACMQDLMVAQSNTVEGAFIYSADGGNWRADSTLNPFEVMGFDTTSVLTESGEFAYFDRTSGTLLIESGSPTTTHGIVLPNPLLQAVQFLVPLSDANAGFELQLPEVRAAAAAADLSGVAWEPVTFEDKQMERAEIPGAVYEGAPYVHRVYVQGGRRDRPLVIDRITEGGVLLSRTRLSHYQKLNPFGSDEIGWPRSVTLQGFDPGTGNVAVELSMVIDELKINDPASISAVSFTLDPASADAVVINGVTQP